jgi:hypothetical protein
MPMNGSHLETSSHQNVRLVPVTPEVKSSKTRELSLCGVREIGGIEKSADPTCYDGSRSMKTGLFDIVEMNMKLTNEQCRDQALIQFELGNYCNAMRWYNTAAARTIGHKKRDDYEAKAEECAKLAGAAYDRCHHAEDYEAVDLAA